VKTETELHAKEGIKRIFFGLAPVSCKQTGDRIGATTCNKDKTSSKLIAMLTSFLAADIIWFSPKKSGSHCRKNRGKMLQKNAFLVATPITNTSQIL
jgi:hypothetical protein